MKNKFDYAIDLIVDMLGDCPLDRFDWQPDGGCEKRSDDGECDPACCYSEYFEWKVECDRNENKKIKRIVGRN